MIHSILIFTLSGIPLYQKHFSSRQYHYDSSFHSTYDSNSSSAPNQNNETHSSQAPPISMLQALITSMWRTAWNLSHGASLSHMHFENMSVTMKVDTIHGLMCVLFHSDEGEQTYEFCYMLAGEVLDDFIKTILEARSKNSSSWNLDGEYSEESDSDFDPGVSRGKESTPQRPKETTIGNPSGNISEKNVFGKENTTEKIKKSLDGEKDSNKDLMKSTLEHGDIADIQSLGEASPVTTPHAPSSSHLDGESIPSSPLPGEDALRTMPSNPSFTDFQSNEMQTSERLPIKGVTSEELALVNERFFIVCNNLRDKLIRNVLLKQPGCVSAFLIHSRDYRTLFDINSPTYDERMDSTFSTYDSGYSQADASFDASANINTLISQAKDVMHEQMDEVVHIQVKLSDEYVIHIAKISNDVKLVVKYQENRSKFLKTSIDNTITILRYVYKLLY